ncbi:MAG: sugar transferase [Candidatus Helarchaeota archaeon]
MRSIWDFREKFISVCLDLFLIFIANICCGYLLDLFLFDESQASKHIILNVFVIPIFIFINFAIKRYEFGLTFPFKNEIRILFKSLLITFLSVFVFTFFVLKRQIFSRYFILAWFLFSVIILLIARSLVYLYLKSQWRKGKKQMRTVVIGKSKKLERYFRVLDLKKVFIFNNVGSIPYKSILSIEGENISANKIKRIINRYSPDIVFVCLNKRILSSIAEFFKFGMENIEFQIILDDMIWSKNCYIKEYQGLVTLSYKTTEFEHLLKKSIKRILDIMISLVGFILSLPIWIFYYLFLKIVSPGPLIHKTKRLGQYGVTFTKYKFRTMVVNAEEKLKYILDNNEKLHKEYYENYKLKNDPRIIKFGNFFRKYSIDEFPQLLNVLKGDMSIVGPRDILESELSKYKDYEDIFLSVKPGVTGLWQINGRSTLNYEERVLLDIFYIENWSLWIDMEIILKTFWVVFTGYGAV